MTCATKRGKVWCMTHENVLLQYKEQHFGRFISEKPKNFSDLKPFKNTKFPNFMIPEYDKKESDNYEDLFAVALPPTPPNQILGKFSNLTIRPNRSYVPGLSPETFYDHIKNPDTNCYSNVPKRLPIIKHGEYKIVHKLTSFEAIIYEVLCIFPLDIIVPGTMRMFNYYGLSEWFEPFSAPEEEAQSFIKQYKAKINRKY